MAEMEIIVENPPPDKPIYQAEIYRLGNGEYEVMVGKMGTEKPSIPNRVATVVTSDFLNRRGINEWVNYEAGKLLKEGEQVTFATLRSVSFSIDSVLEQIHQESVAKQPKSK